MTVAEVVTIDPAKIAKALAEIASRARESWHVINSPRRVPQYARNAHVQLQTAYEQSYSLVAQAAYGARRAQEMGLGLYVQCQRNACRCKR